MNSIGNYDDIIELPHHVSALRRRMSAHERAAQFSSFAALSGYEDEIKETGRLTERMIEPDDDIKAIIDARLQILLENKPLHPNVSITYFEPDKLKSGGKYVTASGRFKSFDEEECRIILADGTSIGLCTVYNIEGDIFTETENK